MHKNIHKKIKQLSAACLGVMMTLSICVVPTAAANIQRNRLQGSNRYATSTVVADELYKTKGSFSNIVVAYGEKYPDALAGDYLAQKMNAPMLLTKESHYADTIAYINSHMAEGGTVYVLGGESCISNSFSDALIAEGKKVVRLGGATRFDTNLQILEQVYQQGNNLFICSSEGFADALSVSGLNYGILLTSPNGLNEAQKAFLTEAGAGHVWIIGGTGAVPSTIEDQLRSLGYTGERISRIGGYNRYETVNMVRKAFYPNGASSCYLVGGTLFPDGLSVGPLAAAKGVPIYLVNDKSASTVGDYIEEAGITNLTIIGGTSAVSSYAEAVVCDEINLDYYYAMADQVTANNISSSYQYYYRVQQANRQCAAAQYKNPNVGQDLADWARQWEGKTPYVGGGSSLTAGADCLGFVKACYRDYLGIDLFFEAFDALGKSVDFSNVNNLQPGDIIYYDPYPYAATWHYALYLGNGECISASSPSAGTVIRKYDYRPITKVRRMFCYNPY